MPRVDRNQPRRSQASESTYSLMEFMRDFPDDATCLDYLVAKLYPQGIYCPTCAKVTKHHRERSRPSYACQWCGHREHPLVGTIFERSATSLHLWFYAIYLMSSTRCGISAKQLERELGVTYKTAWRMFNKIRSLLSEDGAAFGGIVEMDEAYIGGKAQWRAYGPRTRRGRPGRGSDKTPVFGMAQRGRHGQYGRIYAKVVDGVGRKSLMPHIQTKVLPKTVVFTDELHTYDTLGKLGHTHTRVRHSAKVYVSGDAHTNTVEGFWSLVKRGISGVYHGVSTKHLQAYLDEYVFRYNHRGDPWGMFNAFLGRVRKVPREIPQETSS